MLQRTPREYCEMQIVSMCVTFRNQHQVGYLRCVASYVNCGAPRQLLGALSPGSSFASVCGFVILHLSSRREHPIFVNDTYLQTFSGGTKIYHFLHLSRNADADH